MRKLHPLRASFQERFWKYVHKTDGCWLWTGFLDKDNRGHLRRGRANEGQVQASVASWIIHFGKPKDDLFVLHTCDNGRCVRPDHLYLGTQQRNMRDMVERGRHWMLGKGEVVAGDKNPNSRLTWNDVRTIREMHKLGKPIAPLAKVYGVTKEALYHIVHNRTWVV